MDLVNQPPAKHRPLIISSWSGTAKSIRIFRKNQQQSLLKKSIQVNDSNNVSENESLITETINIQNVEHVKPQPDILVASADCKNVQNPITDRTKSYFIQTNVMPDSLPGRIMKIITSPRKNKHVNRKSHTAQTDIPNLTKIRPKTQGISLIKDDIGIHNTKKRLILSANPLQFAKSGNLYKSSERLGEDKIKPVMKNALTEINPSIDHNTTPDLLSNVKYRIIYPKDLEINGNSEITFRDDQSTKTTSVQHNCNKEEVIHVPQETSNDSTQSIMSIKNCKFKKRRRKTRHEFFNNSKENILDEYRARTKITRSGRTVKLPNRSSDDSPRTIRHKTRSYVDVLTCLRCHAKFHGVAKMNRHFAIYPTHKPNNIHTNLFMCFLDIMKNTPADNICHAFIEQLDELIVKIKSMLPCMINNIDSNDGKLCRINEDLGRMLDIEPGKYNISFYEAMKCYENRRENKCKHIMKSGNTTTSDSNKPSQILKQLSQHNEEATMSDTENSDCARIHSVDEWQLTKKRIKKCLSVQMITDNNLSSSANVDVTTTTYKNEEPSSNSVSNLQNTDWVQNNDTTNSCKKIYSAPGSIQMPVLDQPVNNNSESLQLNVITIQSPLIPKENVTQIESLKIPNENVSHFSNYQTSHFNIKSSPIKSTNTLFKKIQIKENVPIFVELGKDENSQKSSDIQLDLNEMLSELTNSDLANDQQQEIGEDDTNAFYDAITDQEEVAVNSTQKDYTLQSNNNVCNISQCLPHNNFLLPNEPAVMSPSDRLLSSESSHLNRNDCLMTDLSQSSDRNNHRSQNEFVSNTSTRVGQNDCLLSGRNNAMSKNDRLLSSSNVQLPQSDQFLSRSMQTPQNDSLASLCVSEANLEGGRMSLPLLDQLGADCLSFADTELRGSSLDLPLDLFPFNHGE